MSTSRILDLCREGRITPAQAAMLIELRHRLILRRRPWWRRFLSALGRAVFSW